MVSIRVSEIPKQYKQFISRLTVAWGPQHTLQSTICIDETFRKKNYYYNFKSQSRWKSFFIGKKIVSCYTHAMRDCRLSFVWFIFSRPLWKIQGEKVLLRIIIFSDWIAWRLLCLKPYTLTSIHQVSLELCSYSSVFFSKCVWACDIRFRGLCVYIMTSSFLFSYCWLSIDIDETLCVSKPNQWNLENVFFI